MNMKKTILSALLFLGVLSASAQEPQEKTEYVFNPHWYVQIQPLGAQYTLGEVGFGDLLSLNAQAAVGYNFNKVVGARLAVNAWHSRAGLEINNSGLNRPDYKIKWGWKYVAPMLDVTFNLSNLFCGVNPNRLFTLSAFAGVGANIGFDNDGAIKANQTLNAYLMGRDGALSQDDNIRYAWDGTKVRLTGQAGLIGDFRVSDAVSINLEVNANTLNDHFNSKRAGNADWYFNALAGVKINLGKTHSTRVVKGCEPEIRYVDRVVEKIVEVPVNQGTDAADEIKVEPIRREVFFTINSTKIRPEEAQKVKDIADYMQKYPNAKVVLTGYADKGTGNKTINARLAKQRAEVVTKALKQQYGISADRITFDSKGDTVQPFAENDKNRVTIIIAE
jgi:outer membrane protein OmpA-like peptidoglycan-associated protein